MSDKFLMDKEHYLVNTLSLGIAVGYLCNLTGKPMTSWVSKIAKEANSQCDQLTDEQIEKNVQAYLDENKISQPDPEWDYYEIWQLLESTRNKIDRGLELIANKEQADDVTDKNLKEILELAADSLEEIIESHLTNYFYED